MKEAEINDQGLVMCPHCGYYHEADPGKIIDCEYCRKKFKAVSKAAA